MSEIIINDIELGFEINQVTQTEGDAAFQLNIITTDQVGQNETIKIKVLYNADVLIGIGNDIQLSSPVTNDTISLTIPNGETSASINITSFEDFIEEDTETITFQILQPESDLVLGDNTTFTYNLQDKSFENPINFSVATLTQTETDDSFKVILQSDHILSKAKTVTISLTPSTNFSLTGNPDITLSKNISNNTITLNMNVGKDTTSFIINPEPDFENETDETIQFEISDVSNGLNIGTTNTFSYTLENFDPELIASYLMDGDANDDVGTNHGTQIGTTSTTNRHDETDKALYFDGIDDYINIPHTELLNFDLHKDFSISVWVEPDHDQQNLAGQCNGILYKWNDWGTVPYPYSIRYFNQNAIAPDYSEYTFGIARHDQLSDVYEVVSNINSRDNDWNHIVFVKQGSSLKLYQNGQLINTSTDNTQITTKNNLDIRIGCRLPNSIPSGRYFAGKIDDLMFFDKALPGKFVEFLSNE